MAVTRRAPLSEKNIWSVCCLRSEQLINVYKTDDYRCPLDAPPPPFSPFPSPSQWESAGRGRERVHYLACVSHRMLGRDGMMVWSGASSGLPSVLELGREESLLMHPLGLGDFGEDASFRETRRIKGRRGGSRTHARTPPRDVSERPICRLAATWET